MYYYLEGWVDLGWYREFAEYAPGIFAIHNQTEDNQIQGKPRPERVLYRDSDGSSARYENPNRGLSLNLGNISHLRVIVSTVGNLQSPVDPRGSKDRLQEFQSTKFRNRWQQTRRPYRGRAAITIGMKTAPATLERRFTGRAAEMLSSYLHFTNWRVFQSSVFDGECAG